MTSVVRKAQVKDVPRLVEISEYTRQQFEIYQPIFWRKAKDSVQKQQLYFNYLLKNDKVTAFVHITNEIIDGFIIGSLVSAPPVYALGGETCLLDDFALANLEHWQTTGQVSR
jgi:hypothetical protein